MFLKGKDIYLRAIEPEDLELFYNIENNTMLWDCTATNVPYSRFAIKNFIANTTYDIYSDKEARFVVCRVSDDIPVAFADITGFRPEHLRAEVGIVVFPPFRRRGIAAEAVALLDEYAMKKLLIHTLYAVVSESNTASLCLFEKAGYSRIATLPQWIATEGGYVNAVLFTKTLN